MQVFKHPKEVRMAKFRLLAVLSAVVLTLALASTNASASAQVFVQNSGTSPAGGDPNIITNNAQFVVGVAGGNFTLQDPLLIIVGVFDGNGTPCISFGNINCEGAATIGTYGLDHKTASMGSGQDAYVQLGLTEPGSGQASESFVNWSGADVAHGFGTPTGFELYAFAINTQLMSGYPITIDESGAAAGSFIIGFDCRNDTGSSSGCTHPGDVAATPFTNSGLLEHGPPRVPEPASLALLGSGLVLGGGLLRRKFRATR